MMIRDLLIGTLAFIAIVALGLAVIFATRDEPKPELLVHAGVKNVAPLVIPRPDALFAPCPLTPRNFPQIRRREA